VILNKKKNLTVFADLSDDKHFFVYGISFDIRLHNESSANDEMRFDISHIVYQEEGDSHHNVCFSHADTFAIYNYTNDKFDVDVYLDDKYDDCADLYLSEAIDNIFNRLTRSKSSTTIYSESLNEYEANETIIL